MCVETLRLVNVWSQIKQNMSNFHPLEVVGRGWVYGHYNFF